MFRPRSEVLRQLGHLIFSGAHDAQPLIQLSNELGFDPAVPRVALAVDYVVSDVSTILESDQVAVVQRIARYLRVAFDQTIHIARDGHFVVWAPCTCRDSPIACQRVLFEALGRFADEVVQLRAVGVGLVNEGWYGLAASSKEAIAALEFARDDREATKIFLYSDIAIDKSIRADESAMRYFENVLKALSNEKNLVHTLRSYFENFQHHKATAAALCIHPNTLSYRLDRIEALLDANLNAPSWIARLFIALKLYEAPDVETSHPDGHRQDKSPRCPIPAA